MTAHKLFYNLVLFGRLLRTLGLDVDSGRMVDLIQALAWVEIGDRAEFYFTLRGLLVRRKEDLELFEQAFKLFWQKPAAARRGMRTLVQGQAGKPKHLEFKPPALGQPRPDGGGRSGPDDGNTPPLVEATLTYSAQEVLRHKDFGELDPLELEQIHQFMARLDWQLGQRRTRRFHAGKGARLDLRHLLRGSLHREGEILSWPRKQPKTRPRPLVLLADISGSMERYTRLLLRFIYSLNAGLEQHVESFVFSTRLTRITHALARRDVERALAEVGRKVPDWAGGTRIGDALKEFNFHWSRRVLGHGAVVLLISDGWDCGDDAVLRSEIARLQRSCSRLVWLNPLLGGDDYEPLTRGMRTAMAYIDDFLPVHNLVSLEDLAEHLRQIGEERPVRRSKVDGLYS